MSGERLYHTDAYSIHFTASIVERINSDGLPAVILDHSLFYPDSGGQPHDTGKINDIAVINVYVRQSDQAVVHVLKEAPQSDSISGDIDWTRRFDHMQQHTGQHILSRAFLELFDADTLSFHLGDHESTIDIDIANLRVQDVLKIENLTNKIIWENRPVKIQFLNKDEVESEGIRSVPDLERDRIRIITVDRFDKTACGGTHVSYTGEIGQLKILKSQSLRGGRRISFICGGRALKDYQHNASLIYQLASDFTTSPVEIKESVDKLRDENIKRLREIKKLRKRTIELEAEKYVVSAVSVGNIKIIKQHFSHRDPNELRQLANRLSQDSSTIVLFALNEPNLHFIFCRSNDAPGEMNLPLNRVIEEFESTKGGGSEKFAQASGPQADTGRVNRALKKAQQLLVELLN